MWISSREKQTLYYIGGNILKSFETSKFCQKCIDAAKTEKGETFYSIFTKMKSKYVKDVIYVTKSIFSFLVQLEEIFPKLLPISRNKKKYKHFQSDDTKNSHVRHRIARSILAQHEK